MGIVQPFSKQNSKGYMKVIEKNSREVIVVQESEYKDNTFVDIRVHGKNDNDDLIPTKKGVIKSKVCPTID